MKPYQLYKPDLPKGAPDDLLIAEINKLHDRLEQMQKANAYGESLNHKLALRVAELEAENAKLAQQLP